MNAESVGVRTNGGVECPSWRPGGRRGRGEPATEDEVHQWGCGVDLDIVEFEVGETGAGDGAGAGK